MIRHLEAADYDVLSPLINEWWGGRQVSGLLPRLFFEHFRPTSFAIEDDGKLKGFLVGFLSQTTPVVGYVHFIGVSPTARSEGFGRMLYERFFDVASGLGCTEVRAITSPVNEGSIQFHLRMGFEIMNGGGEVNGIAVSLNHAGPGQHRVLFRKALSSHRTSFLRNIN